MLKILTIALKITKKYNVHKTSKRPTITLKRFAIRPKVDEKE